MDCPRKGPAPIGLVVPQRLPPPQGFHETTYRAHILGLWGLEGSLWERSDTENLAGVVCLSGSRLAPKKAWWGAYLQHHGTTALPRWGQEGFGIPMSTHTQTNSTHGPKEKENPSSSHFHYLHFSGEWDWGSFMLGSSMKKELQWERGQKSRLPG